MKCKVCQKDAGRYVLCAECNKKRESGEVIKCNKCGEWHYLNSPCEDKNLPTNAATVDNSKQEDSNNEQHSEQKSMQGTDGVLLPKDDKPFLYNKKQCLMTDTEKQYYDCIVKVLPTHLLVLVQSNLATFIDRTDGARFQNELYRNVDFLITDLTYNPLFVIEINDKTHNQKRRKERDEKVNKICEEAGIPVMKLWTDYGINEKYISEKIEQVISSLPVQRVHHFELNGKTETKKGCYVATCVYGSYDCPQVWTLRRFRDETLMANIFGKLFVKMYYSVSPFVVKHFGEFKIFNRVFKKVLDIIVHKLKRSGYLDSQYEDYDFKSDI